MVTRGCSFVEEDHYLSVHGDQDAALPFQKIFGHTNEEVGREVVLELSSLVAPTTREISRANATVIQAYASDPARKQLYRIEEELVEIKNSGMHQLKNKMAEAEKTGRDLLEEMAASVDEKINSIKSKVRDLAGEFD